MAQTVNYIGKEYRASFESVISLVESGCLAGSGVDISVTGTGDSRRIVDRKSGTEFVCGRRERRAEENPVSMEEDGATWFGALRGEKREFPDSAWLALIDKVATAYHKRYSLVEYRRRSRKREDENALREYGRKFAEGLSELFYPDLGKFGVAAPLDAGGDDIYGVSLRLGLSGGTGEAQPVLGHVYFRRAENRMFPLETAAADQIETYISEAVLSDDSGEPAAGGKTDASVVRLTLNALNDLIYPREGNSRFSSCLCLPKRADGKDPVDKKIIEDLSKKTRNAEKSLECKSVKVLGITHVKWENTMLDVVSDGKPLFRIFFGPNNSITLKCLTCGSDEALIENNAAVYKEGERERRIPLDPSRKNFGLDKETVNLLRKNVFSLHLKEISCNIRGGKCERFACKCRTVQVREGMDKCANCPYPEIVWTDQKGIPHYTPDLVFVADGMTLVEKKDAEKCVCCGRGFTLASMEGKRKCAFCTSASKEPKGEEKTRAIKNYRRYAQMLPLRVRLFSAGKKKYCYDDDGVILFVVGGRGYLMNKLDLRDDGFLPAVKNLGSIRGLK